MSTSTPEGVHALELSYDLPDRHLTIHPAAVETDRGVVLVDAGLPDSTDRIAEALDRAGLSLSAVSGVVVTHHDTDHAGGLAGVVEATGATTFAHRDEAPPIDGREAPRGGGEDRYPPAGVDVELVGGVRFRTAAGPMDVVETPGHTRGHVSLHFPGARFLVAGDALFAEGGGLDRPNPAYTADVETAMESVGDLAELDVDRTLCYHGGLVESGTARIREIHERYS